jgi:hypothetical protein
MLILSKILKFKGAKSHGIQQPEVYSFVSYGRKLFHQIDSRRASHSLMEQAGAGGSAGATASSGEPIR